MSQLLNIIAGALGDNGINTLAEKLGESPEQTKSAVDQALPLMVSALSQQPNAGSGWSLLSSFLDRDHDGSIMDDLLGFATGTSTQPPSPANSQANHAALDQILGGARSSVETHLQSHSGLSAQSIQQLLPMLAPLVIGALAKVQRSGNLDQNSLAGMLEQEKQHAATKTPQAAGILGALFDKNGDGNIMDDVTRQGAGLLGKLLS